MADQTIEIPFQPEATWLKRYYSLRFLIAALWAATAFSVGREAGAAATILLTTYPAWDALANYLDARRSGGFARNWLQAVNAGASLATAVAVAFTMSKGMGAVLAVFGIWAIVAGLLQLGAAVRRWKRSGAQWAMVLSGGQSALAGAFFVTQASGGDVFALEMIAGYASVGAFYFLISALWLVAGDWLRNRKRP